VIIMYAIIRVRGNVNIAPDVKKTFEMLNLNSVNHLSLWSETKEHLKMIKTVENYATYGNISEEVLTELINKKGKSKKGKIEAKKVIKELGEEKTLNQLGLVNCFRLSPPIKGYERKGIKKPFSIGGVLGDRKEKIDELIKKMM